LERKDEDNKKTRSKQKRRNKNKIPVHTVCFNYFRLFILILNHNPFEVFAGMADGALGNPHRLRSTIVKAIPLVITSLGISVAFKMKFWNIGGEGQIFMGAYLATFVYRMVPDLSRLLCLL
jgi:simple sugar transport system permease protein